MSTKPTDRPAMAEFEALVQATMKEKRLSRDRAFNNVVKRFPKLHANVVREANADRPVAIEHSRFRADD
jgi:hypothetical protein